MSLVAKIVMTKHHSSFIARNINLCAYLGLFLAVSLVNVYTYFLDQLDESLEYTWTIVFLYQHFILRPYQSGKLSFLHCLFAMFFGNYYSTLSK